MVAQPLNHQRLSLIDHPEHVPLIIIRPHYLDILGGERRTQDVVAGAALLGVFEYWTALRKKKAAQDPRPRPGWDWMIKSLQQLSDVLLGMFGTKTLRAALKLLADHGLITIRENPMLKVDRKRQYRLEVTVVRAAIAQWVMDRQAAEGTTTHLAKTPDGEAELTDAGAKTPNDAAKTPDASAESAESDLRESSSETLSDNPDPDPFVADATGEQVQQEEPVLTKPDQPEATPSSNAPVPSSPVPPPPSSQAAGAPEGYEYRYAPGGSGKTVHLVALGTTATMCGKSITTLLDTPKEGRSYSMCPQCMSKRDPKPRVDQSIRDAVAKHVQGFDPSLATDLTGVLASTAIAVWMRLLGRKLKDDEYTRVARSVEAFANDWEQQKPNAEKPTGKDSFENWFTKFVSSVRNSASDQKGADHGSTTERATNPYAQNSSRFKAPRRD